MGEKGKIKGNNGKVDRFAKMGPQAVSGFLFRLLSHQYLTSTWKKIWESYRARPKGKLSIYQLGYFLVFTYRGVL